MSNKHQTQAERIYAKFGGVPKLHKALANLEAAEPVKWKKATRAISAIYRWNLPKEHGGTGGMVPNSAVPAILAAAKLDGLVVTADDLYSTKTA
jgi:hypothetical protein